MSENIVNKLNEIFFLKCDDTKTKLSVDYIEICEILNVNMEKNRSIYII